MTVFGSEAYKNASGASKTKLGKQRIALRLPPLSSGNRIRKSHLKTKRTRTATFCPLCASFCVRIDFS
ncbi:MAG: hypothetical protein K2N58_08350 [Treponemataceae bacterium]|nr:hypothetical protein [Treponemataceae bacterium]